MSDTNNRYDNDVFISYSGHQRRAAELVRDVLRENMLSCWIAPECIPAGSDYTAEIPRAIRGCKVLVLILSSDAQRSQWVCSEVNNAIKENKVIIPFAIQNCKIESQFDFAISKSQRINAYKNLSAALEELVTSVYALVERELVPVQQAYLKRRLRVYRRKQVILTVVAVLLAAAIFTGSVFAFGKVFDRQNEPERFVSGSMGDCAWAYHEDTGELVISGEGSTYITVNTSPWASYADEIKTLTVEQGVTELNFNLMENCTALIEVSLPDSLRKLYGGTFMNCTSLEQITLPNGLTDIGTYTFSGCKSLRTIIIPASVENLNFAAFQDAGLSRIEVLADNPQYCSIDGVLFDKAASNLISFPCGYEQTTYRVPDGVTAIGERAFFNCTSLRAIEMPDTLVEIGDTAFFGCSALTKADFSDHLSKIGKKAFSNTAIQSVDLPASVTRVGEEAFLLCIKLTSVTMDTAADTIEAGTFSGCSHLTDVALGDPLKRIESDAFRNCVALKSIAIPDTVTSIDDTAFDGCKDLTLIGAPDSEAQRYAEKNGFSFQNK